MIIISRDLNDYILMWLTIRIGNLTRMIIWNCNKNFPIYSSLTEILLWSPKTPNKIGVIFLYLFKISLYFSDHLFGNAYPFFFFMYSVKAVSIPIKSSSKSSCSSSLRFLYHSSISSACYSGKLVSFVVIKNNLYFKK